MMTEKIDFELEVIDGYPPISTERLNAKACGEGNFEILNTPFFVPETAYGDIVTASISRRGRLEFVRCVKSSPYKAVSVIILDAEMDRQLMDDLRGRDCVIEYGEFGVYRMLAIGVPPTTDYVAIKALLDKHEKSSKLSYSELVA
jgi:hypothetical protein